MLIFKAGIDFVLYSSLPPTSKREFIITIDRFYGIDACAGILKLLRSLGSDSKETIPPVYVARRAPV
jgi:hypothetical protein